MKFKLTIILLVNGEISQKNVLTSSCKDKKINKSKFNKNEKINISRQHKIFIWVLSR